MISHEEMAYILSLFPAEEQPYVRYDATVKDDNGYYHIVWCGQRERKERCLPVSYTFTP